MSVQEEISERRLFRRQSQDKATICSTPFIRRRQNWQHLSPVCHGPFACLP
jgi:hypothetical protein